MFQTQLTREQQFPLNTLQRWIKQYLEKGLDVHVYIMIACTRNLVEEKHDEQ
jgi:hypothetical protein